MATGETIKAAHARGGKVRNRHTNETGVVETIAANGAGTWYHVATERGSSLGWWHETDIQGAPKTMPPSEKPGGTPRKGTS